MVCMVKIILIFAILSSRFALAAPSISGVSGSTIHGESFTVSGSDFGSKSPAAPLMWDDCESATVNSASAVTGSGSSAQRSDSATGWDYAAPISAADSSHNMMYRTSWNSMAHAHSRSTKYLAGSHYTDCGGAGPCNEVSVAYNDGPVGNRWIIKYYLRLDPEWEDVSVNGQNYKEIRFGGINCTGGDECSRYLAHATDAYNVFLGTELIQQNPNSYWCQLADEAAQRARSIGDLRIPNPVTNWVHREIRLQENPGIFEIRTSNSDAHTYYSTNVWDTPIVCESGEHLWNTTEIGMISIGTYARAVLTGGTTDARMKRYFDDIYLDNTWSRVMICNNSTYNSATICEPQIPSAWSATSITAKVNQGALSTGTAYLFVFDSDNAASGGYAITLGANLTLQNVTGLTITGASFD